jgi:Cellulase (glycosyl hydrolase family 5)
MTAAGLLCPRRLPGRLGAMAGSALLAAGLLTAGALAGNSPASAATPPPPPSAPLQPPCTGAKAAGPFTIGTDKKNGKLGKTEVLGGNGKQFISYGTTVPGLLNKPSSNPKYSNPWQPFVSMDEAKMTATADDWCGNTIRIQVSQDSLWGPNGNDFNMAYLEAIEADVRFALGLGLVVVINDTSAGAAGQAQPTSLTEKFWTTMTLIYGYNVTGSAPGSQDVIFDLFNEPSNNLGTLKATWRAWRDDIPGHGQPYIGMQLLAKYVRDTLKAQNLFWVEGPYASATFSGMERDAGLLTGVGPVVYALHHPWGILPNGTVAKGATRQNSAAWYLDFGYLVEDDLAPVVDGEWTNYMPGYKSPSGECWQPPFPQIPYYLRYLAVHHVGLSAYQLTGGELLNYGGVFRAPTLIYPNGAPGKYKWMCSASIVNPGKHQPRIIDPDEGAGLLIMNWFRQCNPASGETQACANLVRQTTPAAGPPAPAPVPRPRCPHRCPPGARRHHVGFPGHPPRLRMRGRPPRLLHQEVRPCDSWAWSAGHTRPGYRAPGCQVPTPTASAATFWTWTSAPSVPVWRSGTGRGWPGSRR